MNPNHLLFISGSVGLGHVTRDLAMARALRQALPGVEIDWLAATPGSQVLREAGEHLLPEAAAWADESAPGAELAGRNAARGRPFQFNVLRSFLSNRRQHRRNVEIFRKAVAARSYALIIGDEAYEIALALRAGTVRTHAPFVMLYDFIGIDPMTRHPLEHIGAYVTNRRWACGYRRNRAVKITPCFIGEAEDIPDRPFGPGLPNRRRWTRERCQILGYVLPFDLAQCQDRPALRKRLGYGEEPLVVCTVGGSGVGRELLALCVECHPLLRKEIPDLRMLIVGPQMELPAIGDVPGLELRGYVPALFEHFAASDLVVTQGGGTSTLELTALRRPFLYFPLEGHFEQQIHVAGRLERHGAGIRMRFRETTPRDLAETIAAHIGEQVTYEPIPAEGAHRLAEVARGLIEGP
ncbi:MAG: glycosyltransferase [Candidatus Eisenbacteria bacterium]